jgi:hypothetical protein
LRSGFPLSGWAGVLLLVAVMLTIGACGSTKVYTAQKTIVYNGELYNMGNVQKIGSSMVGTLPNGDTVNMRTLDKKAAQALFKDNDSVIVKSTVQMDDQEMVYQNGRVTKYSDYSKMVKNFDNALNNINKFMADKKKTQLKLK